MLSTRLALALHEYPEKVYSLKEIFKTSARLKGKMLTRDELELVLIHSNYGRLTFDVPATKDTFVAMADYNDIFVGLNSIRTCFTHAYNLLDTTQVPRELIEKLEAADIQAIGMVKDHSESVRTGNLIPVTRRGY